MIGVAQVNPEHLLVLLRRKASWQLLEATLLEMVGDGTILDFSRQGAQVKLTVDGLRQPLTVPVPGPQAQEEAPAPLGAPLEAFEEAPGGASSPAPAEPSKAKPKGRAMLLGTMMLDYDQHVRELVKFTLGRAEEAEDICQLWLQAMEAKLKRP